MSRVFQVVLATTTERLKAQRHHPPLAICLPSRVDPSTTFRLTSHKTAPHLPPETHANASHQCLGLPFAVEEAIDLAVRTRCRACLTLLALPRTQLHRTRVVKRCSLVSEPSTLVQNRTPKMTGGLIAVATVGVPSDQDVIEAVHQIEATVDLMIGLRA